MTAPSPDPGGSSEPSGKDLIQRVSWHHPTLPGTTVRYSPWLTDVPLIDQWPWGLGSVRFVTTTPEGRCVNGHNVKGGALLYADGAPRCTDCSRQYMIANFTACRIKEDSYG